MIKKGLILTLLLFSIKFAFSQGEIPVNMYTGTPNIDIPIVSITSHDLTDDLKLVYNAKGIRVEETSGHFGLGWNMQVGGVIKREVRGLPDDFTGTEVSDLRRGWLYNSNGTTTIPIRSLIGNLELTSDNSLTTCDELPDHQAISQLQIIDTEPDIFHFDFPGATGSFVFNNSSIPEITLIPYQDVQVNAIFSTGNHKKIQSFTITTNLGVVYTFNAVSFESKKITKLTSANSVEFFRAEYSLYNASNFPIDVSYNTSWHLTKVKSTSGDEITYSYDERQYDYTETVYASIRKGFSTNDYEREAIFDDRRYGARKQLVSIQSKAGLKATLFTNSYDLVDKIEISDKRKSVAIGEQYVKQIDFNYSFVSNERAYLISLKESSGAISHPSYSFDYGNIYDRPVFHKMSQDFWGYYNGRLNNSLSPTIYVYPQLPSQYRFRLHPIPGYTGESYTLEGADRTVNPDVIDIGTLKGITYPWGGKTTITYESNTYWDEVANVEQKGGGLRIKSFSYMDGLNPDAIITKNFSYNEVVSGHTSGRLIREPAFVFPTWEYRDPITNLETSFGVANEVPSVMWDAMTVRSERNLAYQEFTHNSELGYKEVTVLRPGSGYVRFEYHVPATSGNAGIGEWSPTLNRFTRLQYSCPSLNIVTGNSINMFPYAPDPNYDYERGLVWRKSEFNEDHLLVRQTETTYQNLFKSGNTPEKVWGIRVEKFPNSDEDIYLIGKYYLLTNVIKLMSEETVKTFDALDNSSFITESSQHFYESTTHKLLNKFKRITSDGTVYTTRVKYPLDYGVIPFEADSTSILIRELQSGRNGVSIETYQTVSRNGMEEKVIDGNITLFKKVGTLILPKQNLQWNSPSSEQLSSFTISTIDANNTFILDDDYEVVSTFLSYGNYGKPRTVLGQDFRPQITVWGFNGSLPLATLTDCSFNQFAFIDFESTNEPHNFNLTSTINDGPNNNELYYGAGHTGFRSISPAIKLSVDLTKGSNVYRLSGWWNKKSSSFDITVKILDNQHPYSTIATNHTLTLTGSGNGLDWEYFEKEIPIDANLSDFKVEITFGAFDAGLLVDDIAFTPKHTILTTYTYQLPFGISSTLTKDKGTITEFDTLGRPRYFLDVSRNILQRRQYKFTNNN